MDLHVCRICCENTGTMYIFDENKLISKKIMYCCANIRVSEDDGLPTHVCSSCEVELTFVYQFVLKCEAAQEKLRTLSPLTKLEEQEIKHEVKAERSDCDSSWNLIPSENNQDEDTISLKSMLVAKKIKCTKNKRKRKLGKLQCKECGQQCKNPSTMAIHMRKHSEHKAYGCTLCDKKYKDRGGLQRHIERNHNHTERKRQFICEVCGKGFYTKLAAKIHARIHTGETPYSCDICSSKFNQIGALLRHKLRHNNERSYSCTKCSKRFQTKENLKQHQVAHSTEKKYVCATCNVPFKYQNNLRKHMKRHFEAENFICDYCSQSFNLKGNLRIHIENMHSDKSGFCTICSKHVPNVETHMWRHNGKRPYKCEMCSSSFYEKRSLSYHMNFRHKRCDKYKCTVNGCALAFPSQLMLDFHVAKFHTSVIPFPCDSCSKGFYRKSDLSRHMLNNHREKLEL